MTVDNTHLCSICVVVLLLDLPGTRPEADIVSIATLWLYLAAGFRTLPSMGTRPVLQDVRRESISTIYVNMPRDFMCM